MVVPLLVAILLVLYIGLLLVINHLEAILKELKAQRPENPKVSPPMEKIGRNP